MHRKAGPMRGPWALLGLVAVLVASCWVEEPCDQGTCRYFDPNADAQACRVTTEAVCTETCLQTTATDCVWDDCESC